MASLAVGSKSTIIAPLSSEMPFSHSKRRPRLSVRLLQPPRSPARRRRRSGCEGCSSAGSSPDEVDGMPSMNAARLSPRLLGVSCEVSLA